MSETTEIAEGGAAAVHRAPQKIDPNFLSVTAFDSHKAARLSLRGLLTFDTVRENPDLWSKVQGVPTKRLTKGDKLDMVSADGLLIAEGFVVTRAVGGALYLSKPLRIITLEADSLYANERYEVVPVGTAYGVKDKRHGRLAGDITYASPAAAEAAVHKLAPRSAA